MSPAMPVPPSVTVWVPILSTSCSRPVRRPDVVGVKRTVKEQPAPTAREVPQLLEPMAKSLVTVGACSVAGRLPLLVTVTVCGGAVAFIAVSGKAMLGGETTTAAVPVPVPLSVAEAYPPRTLPKTCSVPLCAPAADGAKLTCTVQFAPGAMAAPAQLSVSMKPVLAVTRETLSVALPVLVAVRVCEPLV